MTAAGRNPWLVAIVATLAMSVSYLDRQTLAAIAPTIRAELHISHERFGWLGSAFALAYLVCAPLSGVVVDRFGPRRTLALAVLAWSLVSAAHAAAFSFGALLVLRLLLGAFEAPSFPSTARTIQTTLPARRRSAAMGLLFTGSSFGAMVAAPLAARVAHDHGFRFAFVATAALGLLWLPFWLAFAPDDGATASASPKRADASDTGDMRWLRALAALAGRPAVLRQAVVIVGSAPALLVVLGWYPQMLVEAAGVRREDVGHTLWLPPLVFDVAAVGFGAAASALDPPSQTSSPSHGAHPSHRGLMALAALLTATLALVPWVEGAWPRVALGSLAMAGGGGMYVLGTADMLRRISPGEAAAASGLSAAAQSLVHIAANPVYGAWLDRTHRWGPVLAVGALALPAALIWAATGPRAAPTARALSAHTP